jgi:hypothetical protein
MARSASAGCPLFVREVGAETLLLYPHVEAEAEIIFPLIVEAFDLALRQQFAHRLAHLLRRQRLGVGDTHKISIYSQHRHIADAEVHVARAAVYSPYQGIFQNKSRHWQAPNL